jgi:putative ABC transport system permease protein
VQLLKVFGPSELPRIDQIALDARVAAFAVAGTLLTGLLFGLAPIVHLLRTNLQDSLKDGSKGSAGVVSLRLRNAFVVAQVALAVMLVIGSGLLIRSFSNLSNTDPGFEAAGVLTMELDLPSASYADDEAVAAFYAAFSQRLQALPGVSTASMTSSLPLGESLDYLSSFLIANREPPPPGEQNRTYYRQVGHDFFKTMGIPLVKGRHFTAADRADAPGAVIINEAMARQFFPDEDPIGEVLTQTQQRYGPLGAMLLNEVEVVGVVRDVRYVGLKEEPQPSLYFPHQQAPFRRMTVILRTATDPTSMIAAARYELAEIDPDMPISRIQSMEQVLADSIAQERFAMLLLGVFALTALTLAAVGIYGVLSYNVEQRTRELGIRIVLGADASDVREYVLRRSLWLVGGGILIGLVGAFSLSRILVSQLYGVASTDLITFISVPILLALVALVASYTPAQRATRVDPIVALRYQ